MTTLEVFADTQLAIKVHVFFAIITVGLTPFVIWRRVRDRTHKQLGYVWVVTMGSTALSSFFISGFGLIGPFSPIHLLSVYALWTLFVSVRWAIRRNIIAHDRALSSLVTFGMGGPLILIFLPGRTFSEAFFSQSPLLGLALSASVVSMIGLWRLWVNGRLGRGRVRHARA